MKKFLLFVFCILTGCIATPNFVSHKQEIDLNEFQKYNPDAKIYFEGVEQTDKITLFRSWKDKEVIIKKEGFKDYYVKLESEWTDDLWARGDKNTFLSSLWMLLPINAATICFSIPGKESAVGDASAALFVLGICGAITAPADVVNYTALPFLPMVNPWKEYNADEIQKAEKSMADGKLKQSIILEPTDELKQKCNKEGYFISNIGCLPCSYQDAVVASKQEHDKCLSSNGNNRFIDKFGLSHSCKEKNAVLALEEESSKCSYSNDNGRFIDKLGLSYSCNEERYIEVENESCLDCPQRTIVDGNLCALMSAELSKQKEREQKKDLFKQISVDAKDVKYAKEKKKTSTTEAKQ